MRSKNPVMMDSIHDYIETFYFTNGRAPSTTEIGAAVGFTRSTAYKYLVAMAEKGLITYQNGEAMTKKMQLVSNKVTMAANVSGTVPCGIPQCIEANVEEYTLLPVSIFGDGELFIVRASGDSMIEAGIDDGDLVVVRKQETAREGDIVVALVNNENTLKRYFYDEDLGCIRLHPENHTMEDILAEDCLIQGVAMKAIKNL